MSAGTEATDSTSLPKAPSGIRGLDEITDGGLPRGRPTLVCGGPGCGKTLLGMEFLVRGAAQYGEPGVFVAFEETPEDLVQNMESLGFACATLIAGRKLIIERINLDGTQFLETGDYDLEGLFIRLARAVALVGARRIVLDTLENLFASLANAAIIRSELRRLFAWIKARGLTAIVTGERGTATLTRYGIEEYVSDCVIVLDHRVSEHASTRQLRVLKYRGSRHGLIDYPFLIDHEGVSVLPITSVGLDHPAPRERISSGVPALDNMLGGQGYYRGSSILISGTAGSGKTSLAATFLDATARRGERALCLLFEEAPAQLMRNMESIGLDLAHWVGQGSLRFHAARPSIHGLEMHLMLMLKAVEDFAPSVVVIDPISSFGGLADAVAVKAMLIRMVDHLKVLGITTVLTSLTQAGSALEGTEEEISSLIDTWLLVRDIESNGERNRGIYVLKSRGMAHSNQIREFTISDAGISLTEVYVGPDGALTGSARLAQEAREQAETLAVQQEMERQHRALEHKRQALEGRVATLRAEFAAESAEAERQIEQGLERIRRLAEERREMVARRGGDAPRAPGDAAST